MHNDYDNTEYIGDNRGLELDADTDADTDTFSEPEAAISNYAALAGKVVSDPEFSHEVYGEGFYIVQLEVQRLSQTYDILPVTISERLMGQDNIHLGSFLDVYGQIRSYNSYSEAEGRNKLVLTVFARDIEVLDDFPPRNTNEIFLNGYICKPPVFRTTPFGREITDMLVAVNRSYNKSDYVPVITWGRNARFCGRLAVSDNVMLWGRLQSRPYQKKYDDGRIEDKVAFEVSASKVQGSEARD
ncbi:MAG: single-stranded DNA-binding protein [Defluviitaleaceae bacterium]|nr:single-stranded DNA-binding protein [Defluviitaleaceae bacterium]